MTGGAYNHSPFSFFNFTVSADKSDQSTGYPLPSNSDIRITNSLAAYVGSPFTYLLLLYLPEKEMNSFEQHLLEALEIVNSWGIPDDEIAEAANQQARLMAGQYDSYEDRQMTTDSH